MEAMDLSHSDAAATANERRSLWTSVADYLRMIKFSHTIFALPLAGVAFVQALPQSGLLPPEGGVAPGFWLLLLQALAAMAALRSAAMGFNRLVDKKIDAANPRTAAREIPAGRISERAAWSFTLLSLALFFAAAWSINWLTALLSPLAAAAVLGYSYTKRFTWSCHFFLGAAIGIAPTGAWLALLERFDLLPLLWSAGLLFYIAGFDILYSCQDAEFDREAGLNSVPARFGIGPALWIARSSHTIALGCFLGAGYVFGSGVVFYAAAGIVAALFVVEHVLVRPGKLDQIPVAFFHINASISSILFVGVLAEWLLRS